MEITRKVTMTENEGEQVKIKTGDILDFDGTLWRVLDKNDEDCTARIMKINNIGYMRFGDDNDYEKSDIREYLRSRKFKDTLPEALRNMVISEFDLLTAEEIVKHLPEQADRIVSDKGGRPIWWWTATPFPSRAGSERIVVTSGALLSLNAYDSYGVVPACIIRHL